MQTDQEFSSAVQLNQFPGDSVVTRRNAPEDPHQATAETIDRMKTWANARADSPQVIRATSEALRFAGPAEADRSVAIHHWISTHCKFRDDDPVLRIVLGLEDELEMLIEPARLLTMSCPAGDCDCLTCLCMSMHLCAGISIEPITIKADPDEPERDSHVYCQAVLSDGSTLILDPAMGCKHHWPAGAEAPEYFDKQTWGVLYPQQPRRGLQGIDDGLSGLGCDFSGSAEDCGTASYPDQSGPRTVTSADAVTLGPASSGAGFDINAFIKQLTAGGLSIAKMQATPVGYIQTPQGLIANVGPGGQLPLNLGIGSSIGGLTPLLLLGGGLLLVMAISKK